MNNAALLRIVQTFAEANRTPEDFDAVADVLEDFHPSLAQEARVMASLEREKARRQLLFNNLLQEATR